MIAPVFESGPPSGPPLIIGVLFRLVWLKIEGIGLDRFHAPFTRDIYFSKRTPMAAILSCDQGLATVQETKNNKTDYLVNIRAFLGSTIV